LLKGTLQQRVAVYKVVLSSLSFSEFKCEKIESSKGVAMAAFGIRIVLLLAALLLPLSVEAMVRHYKFNVGALSCYFSFCHRIHAKHSRFKL